MSITDEAELKAKLGISSWRNLSKDKFVAFTSELPNMSKDVALKVVAQFPEFKTLVLGSLSHVHEQATHGVNVNWKSQKRVHKAYEQYRENLTRELDREGLSTEDRFAILEMFRVAVGDEALKDSEHKAFVGTVLKTVGVVALVVVAAGAAALGGKTKAGGGR